MSEVSSGRSPGSAGSSRGMVSRQSGRVTFPQSAKSMSSGKSLMPVQDDDINFENNPFKVPLDQDIFMMRDKERQRKKEERERQRKLHVHQKTTYTSRVNAKTASMRKAALGNVGDDATEDQSRELAVNEDPGWTLAVTRDRNVEKEDLAEYVSKKREMFLVQYSLRVKRDEMRKLEDLAAAEERKLERAEHFLEEDAAMFDEFLKENDKNSVEAIKIAESETKAKLEKVAEIKKNNAIMMSIKSDISKHEETLKEYLLYKEFLEKLTPNDWKEAKKNERIEKRRQKKENLPTIHQSQSSTLEKRSLGSATSTVRRDVDSRGSSRVQSSRVRIRGALKSASTSRKTISTPKSGTDSESVKSVEASIFEEESDEEPELYFTDPAQLLNIFQELEEHNLSLITNSQETEEAMEELKQTIAITKEKMNRETDILKGQISMLKGTIRREEEKADDLELKCKMFSYGEFKAEDQEKTLKQLHKKVEEVYRGCIGDNEANISSLQMLTTIENKLEDLFENIEVMPPELVDAAEKAKEKERRMRLREEKLAAQRAHQEERVRKALERAKAEPKKKVGKRLIYRSDPPQRKQKENKKKEGQDKEEEEKLYFFS